jgi:hypothetical protein
VELEATARMMLLCICEERFHQLEIVVFIVQASGALYKAYCIKLGV